MSKIATVLVAVVMVVCCNAVPVPQFTGFGFPPVFANNPLFGGGVFSSAGAGLPSGGFQDLFMTTGLPGNGVGGFTSSMVSSGGSGGSYQGFVMTSNTSDGKTKIDVVKTVNGKTVHEQYEQ